MDNLLAAWQEFKRGKSRKQEVQEFAFSLEDNLFDLHERLRSHAWFPDPYVSFRVADPKPRQIHKASVRDRVLYQAVFQQLYPIFDKSFIHDSYASRTGKGTLSGVLRFEEFARKASGNYSHGVFILKCDIRKFFDCIDHRILFELLSARIDDAKLLHLLALIIKSFEKSPCMGLPLGNVTSQLFANIYLNELDQYLKRIQKERYYIRYCDDFIVVSKHFDKLHALIPRISEFLESRLKLFLHPHKISVRPLAQGLDFLGYVAFPRHKVLRTRTKRRMFRRCKRLFSQRAIEDHDGYPKRMLSSYKGLLSHAREYRSWKRLEQLYAM